MEINKLDETEGIRSSAFEKKHNDNDVTDFRQLRSASQNKEVLGEVTSEHKETLNEAKGPVLDFCCSLTTPFQRRLQTTIVAWHVSSFVIFTILILSILSTPICWIVAIPYLIYFVRDRSPANGDVVKRYSLRFRSLSIWTQYCKYFPISLYKTIDLEPTFTPETVPVDDKQSARWKWKLGPSNFYLNIEEKKSKDKKTKVIQKCTGPRYIFGYHPHGIGALGAFGAFGTEGCNWTEKFPGIPISLMTLVTQFHIPVYRDYLLALGITSVSRKNALGVLNNNQSICIVVGGARESLLNSSDAVELILNKRKGFIKLAVEAGNVSLVPTFAFGENNCYKIFKSEEDSMLRRVQLWVKENCGFTIPIFYARGLFNYDFGLLPFRTPIHIVTGKPIYVKEKYEVPPENIVNHYHDLYIKELKTVFYDNRDKFGMSDVEFKIVG